jgi:VWFA-related protein
MVTASFRSRALLVAVLLAGSIAFLSTQQAAQSSQKPQTSDLVFRSVVNRVILDVVVTDWAGKPVHGLNRRDFAVTEDNVPQRVLSFDVRDLDTASESLPPNLPPMPVNTFLNLPAAPERGPLYVLLLDLVNTEMEDQGRARQELLKFIDSKPAGTRFSVFLLTDGLHLVQGFTSDKDLLHAALDPSHPKHHVPRIFLMGRNSGMGDRGLMLSVFEDIAHYMDGLPGRKNVMWMANHFPISMNTVEGDPYDLADETRDTIDSMMRAEISVYTFTLCGISPDDPTCGSTPGAGGIAGNRPMFDAAIATDVTDLTGGKRYSDNDIKGELADAVQDGANYYTLSYAPSNMRQAAAHQRQTCQARLSTVLPSVLLCRRSDRAGGAQSFGQGRTIAGAATEAGRFANRQHGVWSTHGAPVDFPGPHSSRGLTRAGHARADGESGGSTSLFPGTKKEPAGNAAEADPVADVCGRLHGAAAYGGRRTAASAGVRDGGVRRRRNHVERRGGERHADHSYRPKTVARTRCSCRFLGRKRVLPGTAAYRCSAGCGLDSRRGAGHVDRPHWCSGSRSASEARAANCRPRVSQAELRLTAIASTAQPASPV